MRLGLPELLILLCIAALALVPIWFAWRIVAKTGNTGALALLYLVPVANIVLLGYLAFSEWPIERKLRSLGGSASE